MTLEGRIRALERLVAELRLRAPTPGLGNPGATTHLGATTVRPLQVGFAAKLTSTYDATTGYDWSIRTMSGSSAALVDPTIPLTGTNAVDLAGRTDLAVGTEVWLELDPGGQGYVIAAAGASGGGGDCGPGQGWVARLSQWSCIKASVLSGDVTPTTLYLNYAAGSYTSDPEAMDYGIGSGFLVFGKSTDPRRGTLVLDGTELFFDCAGADDDGTPFLTFEGGVYTAHVADSVSDPGDGACNLESFRIRVECCCAPDGWAGPGWYCVVGAGGDCMVDEVTAVELLDGDECTFEGVICDGPYATEAEALAACNPAPDGGADCASATELENPPATWSGSVNAFSFQWWKFTIATSGTYYWHWGVSDATTFSAAVHKGTDCTSKTQIALETNTASGCHTLALSAGDIVWVAVGNITGAAGNAAWTFDQVAC
jgi:hypothetical protein